MFDDLMIEEVPEDSSEKDNTRDSSQYTKQTNWIEDFYKNYNLSGKVYKPD